MFQLTAPELKGLIFQNGTSSWGGTGKMPFAFTEQGVAMLSGVLNSETAIEVNIRIIRIFAEMRNVLAGNMDILHKIELLEKKITAHDKDIQLIFQSLKQSVGPAREPGPRNP